MSPPPPPGSSSPGVHQGLASYRFASRRPVQRYAAEQRAYVEVFLARVALGGQSMPEVIPSAETGEGQALVGIPRRD